MPPALVAVLLLTLLTAVDVWGASDGALGATSTGSANITLTIPTQVRISGLADLALGTWSGSGSKTANDDVCVYTNNPGAGYRVTATGNGTGGAFTVASGAETVAYEVRWNDQTGTAGNVQLTSGVQLASQTGANTSSQTCGGLNSANFQVTFTSSALAAAKSGAYTGLLSIVVEPA